MSSRTLLFVAVLGMGAAALAVSQIGCQEVLQALADGGRDGGGVVVDGGGGDMDGGGGGGTSSIQVTVTCTGDACDKMGAVVAKVRPGPTCGTGAAPIASETLAGQTITSAAPIMLTVNNVPVGMQCLRVYLDINGNGTQDTGDAISPAGEVTVDVQATGPATTSVELSQLMTKPSR